MTTSSIPPIGPNNKIGRANSNSKGKDKGFQEALAEDASEEEQPARESPMRTLQPEPQVRRRKTEDGRHHIDVIV